jgi:hypothetical protein
MSRFPDEALHKHFNRVYGIDDNQEAGSRDQCQTSASEERHRTHMLDLLNPYCIVSKDTITEEYTK